MLKLSVPFEILSVETEHSNILSEPIKQFSFSLHSVLEMAKLVLHLVSPERAPWAYVQARLKIALPFILQ